MIFISNYIGNYRLCGGKQWSACVDGLADIETILLPFLFVFLFSLITYKMKEKVFQAWFRFTRMFLPVALVLILLAPSYSSNWVFPYTKGLAAVMVSGLFVGISTIKIILAYRKTR